MDETKGGCVGTKFCGLWRRRPGWKQCSWARMTAMLQTWFCGYHEVVWSESMKWSWFGMDLLMQHNVDTRLSVVLGGKLGWMQMHGSVFGIGCNNNLNFPYFFCFCFCEVLVFSPLLFLDAAKSK